MFALLVLRHKHEMNNQDVLEDSMFEKWNSFPCSPNTMCFEIRWLSSDYESPPFTLSDFQLEGKNALLNESLKKKYFRNGVALKSTKIRAVEVETSVEFNVHGKLYLLFKVKIETIR